MSVPVSPAELEYLRTAPAKAIHRSSRRAGRPAAPTLGVPEEIVPEEIVPDHQEGPTEHERWREYCECQPGKHSKLLKKVTWLWKLVADHTEGIREVFLVAGKGVVQMGMVWGAGFCGMGYPTTYARKKKSW